jgi:hypothetical protein
MRETQDKKRERVCQGSSAMESTSQAILASSDQRKVPASMSLFVKSGKISPLLYIGKGPEYRPLWDFRPQGRVCTRPFSRPFRDFRPVNSASGTDFKSGKGLHSCPSPVLNVILLHSRWWYQMLGETVVKEVVECLSSWLFF